LEVPVYDKTTRWLGSVVVLVLVVPIISVLLGLRAIDQRSSGELLIILVPVVIVNVGLFLLLQIATNVWIQIDMTTRRVSTLYKLFWWTVFRRVYDLSQFDHISLHRIYRGGYRAALVGREREVAVAASWRLGSVRQAAERAAAVTGLRLADQL